VLLFFPLSAQMLRDNILNSTKSKTVLVEKCGISSKEIVIVKCLLRLSQVKGSVYTVKKVLFNLDTWVDDAD